MEWLTVALLVLAFVVWAVVEFFPHRFIDPCLGCGFSQNRDVCRQHCDIYKRWISRRLRNRR